MDDVRRRALELRPDATIAFAMKVARLLSTRLAEFLDYSLRRFSQGLGALRSGHHLLRVVGYTLLIWLVASTTQAAIGMAVALPSAPGFFGPYHYACKVALERFGIPPETAIALGTLIHAVFWLSLTGLGLAVLRVRHTSLHAIDEVAAESEGPSSR